MFAVHPLFNSWFGRLNLSLLKLNETEIPSFTRNPDWDCAIDEKNAVMVFQLISTTDQMRDNYYRYVLAAGSRMYVAESPGAKIRLDLSLSSRDQPIPDRSEVFRLTSVAKQGVLALLGHARKPKHLQSVKLGQ